MCTGIYLMNRNGMEWNEMGEKKNIFFYRQQKTTKTLVVIGIEINS